MNLTIYPVSVLSCRKNAENINTDKNNIGTEINNENLKNRLTLQTLPLNLFKFQRMAKLPVAFKGEGESEWVRFCRNKRKCPNMKLEEVMSWNVKSYNACVVNPILENKALFGFLHEYVPYILQNTTEEDAKIKAETISHISKNIKGLNTNPSDTAKLIAALKTHEQSDIFNRTILLDYPHYSKIRNINTIIINSSKEEPKRAITDILNKMSDKKLHEKTELIMHIADMLPLINHSVKAKMAQAIFSDERLYANTEFMANSPEILSNTKTQNEAKIKLFLINKILQNEDLLNNRTFINKATSMIKNAKTLEQAKIISLIMSDKRLSENPDFMAISGEFIENAEEEENAKIKINLLSRILQNKDLLNDKSFIKLLKSLETKEQAQLIFNIISDKKLFSNEKLMEEVKNIIYSTQDSDSSYGKEIIEKAKIKSNVLNEILKNKDLLETPSFINNAVELLKAVETKAQGELTIGIMSDKRLFGDEKFMKNAWYIIRNAENSECAKTEIKILNKILKNENLLNDEKYIYKAAKIMTFSKTPHGAKLGFDILSNERFYNNSALMACSKLIINNTYVNNIENILPVFEDKEISQSQVKNILTNKTASKFIDIYKKQNINEISRESKKDLLKKLVDSKEGIFNIPYNIKKFFPIIPDNQKDYCRLLPSVVRSLGFDTNILIEKDFVKKLNNLGETLEKISEENFKKLEIRQEYSKDEFIEDILKRIKDLPEKEKQKVFDYFGFELYRNDEKRNNGIKYAATGYSIAGYPVNLNNGEKLSQIESAKTRQIIEDLRQNVIRFSKNNKIICENKELENDLNNIIKFLPELRPLIGCNQHGEKIKIQDGTEVQKGHQFDVFKHSLKVMQGIVKDAGYKNLKNPEDKKIMLLASLLHDIAKKEGALDKYHADNSSFDASFIVKKFKLEKETEIKLFTLIKNHEWNNYVNSAATSKERTQRQQSVAYDLRHDNLFDMSLIFTHADLKAVNDEFHDLKNEKRISKADGITRSYGEAADFHAKEIKKFIEELKPSQPLLPVTPIPSSNTIQKAITNINADGSTNIKGVYKDKDGLIVLKYNELENEDLEKIGFPIGSITKGITAKTSAGEDVNTGNIKFFAHGLDYSNQLAKFNAFSLIDSDVLLSVSYAERPESKYRFFRAQGILLDCDTKYVHGGGETDSGSGCGKEIKDFKKRYIFGGDREGDRKFISKLIKNALNIESDKEYIDFVDKHKNSSMLKIEEDKRNALIRAFAEINSSIRTGKREYNEMYISNPKPPMAVFAYAENYHEKINNPLEFLNRTEIQEHELKAVRERTEFLREYAIEKNIPFIVFGD